MRWLLILAVLISSAAWSAEGSPKKPEANTREQQTTAKEQRGTENAPAFIKGEITTKQGAEEAERNRDQQKEKSILDSALVKYTGYLAAFTFLLFAAALFQVGLFVWQLRLIARATKDTGDAAKAATDSVALAREEFLSTHRPKLILRDAYCDDNEFGHPIEVKYVIVNTGESTARIVRSTMNIRVITDGPPGFGAHERITPKAGENEIGNARINPGEGLECVHTSNAKWNNDSRHNISDPHLGVFFCGHLVYEDDREIMRHTMFWRKYDFSECRFYRADTPVIDAMDNAD